MYNDSYTSAWLTAMAASEKKRRDGHDNNTPQSW